MGKLSWVAFFIICAAAVADQYWNYGKYTDSTLTVLRQIQHSFGW
jgi:hypothetical protein